MIVETLCPDFSPRMLRMFLFARVAFKRFDDDVGLVKAREAVLVEVGRDIDVPMEKIKLAYQGKCADPLVRTKIWCALGLDPGAYGFRLIEGGKQEVL